MTTPGQQGERKKRRPAPQPVGKVRGPDGAERDVYEDPDGRQYVLGSQGEKVYGLWLLSVPPRPPVPVQEPPPDDKGPAPEPLEDATAAEEEPPWEHGDGVRRDRERHRGRMLGVLGMVAFCVGVVGLPSGFLGAPGLALALYVRAAARRDLKKMGDGSMDPDGERQTRAALQDANLAAVLSGAGLVLAVLVAIGLLFYLT